MGGGGNDGYEQRQADTEAKKQAARSQLNYLFGYGDGGAADNVSKDKYTTRFETKGVGAGDSGNEITIPGSTFDQEGYDAERAQIAANAEKANTNRGARDSLYQNVRDSAYTAGKRKLDEAQQDAARKTKFELFAKGLNGGSEDINQNAMLGRTYSQGLMDLGAKADSAKADFRNADENTRLQLLQSIDNGMDQGSALSSAAQQMQIASEKAAADASGTAVGDLFDNGSFIYNQSQFAKGRQAGQTDWWQNYAPGRNKNGSAVAGVSTRLPGE